MAGPTPSDRGPVTGDREAGSGTGPRGAYLSLTGEHHAAPRRPRQPRGRRRPPGRPAAGLARRRPPLQRCRRARVVSAPGVRRRVRRPEVPDGCCRPGRGVRPPGRRLRRDVRRGHGRQHPRPGQDDPADGGGAHLRRVGAGGQGRPDGRAVRQAWSSNDETREGVTLPAYRGDMVNDFEFTLESRTPDPQRLVHAYHASSATLNLVRAFTTGGFADLRHVHDWNKGFIANSANVRYERLAKDIDKAMKFMRACGADFEAMRTTEFFSSHEALLLDYERPLTRIDSRTGELYDTSGHFIWVGERTRDIDGAHIDFVSKVLNPIGIKLSAKAEVEDVLRLIDKVDPDREPGRLTFITRMGARTVRDALPPLVDKITGSGAQVTWICDPMHGNTFESESGYKTRDFEDVVEEVRGFFEVHQGLGTVPGGIHVELTGNDVTECIGGAEKILDADLTKRYETVCDPRLNHQQSLELAFLVAEMLAKD